MTANLSRQMSYLLRHNPSSKRLNLDSAGWVPIKDLAAALGVEEQMLLEVVSTDTKTRFALKAPGLIRANQGHSIDIDLGLTSATPPPILFHGTVERFLPSIKVEGLRPMSRHAVHLSPTRETAVQVGSRRGEAIILKVDSLSMHEQGHVFEVSDNGVWLIQAVPPRFILF